MVFAIVTLGYEACEQRAVASYNDRVDKKTIAEQYESEGNS